MTKFRAVSGLVLMIILLGFYYYFVTVEQFGAKQLNFDPTATDSLKEKVFPWTNFLVTCLCMATGILFGSFYAQIRDKKNISSYKIELTNLFSSTHLIKSFLIAPIIFIGIYKAADANPDMVLSALFAFQNGFFCDTIMRKNDKETS